MILTLLILCFIAFKYEVNIDITKEKEILLWYTYKKERRWFYILKNKN